MILREDGRVLIASIKVAAICKVDHTNCYPLIVKHGDRLCVQLPLVIRGGKGRSKVNFCMPRSLVGLGTTTHSIQSAGNAVAVGQNSFRCYR
jgi:hypothetical protein